MKLKPIGSTIDLEYRCPHCDDTFTVTSVEVNQIGKAACWRCSKVLELEPIKIVARFPGGTTKKPKKPKRTSKPRQPKRTSSSANEQEKEDIIRTLMSIGHKKSEASKLVETGIANGMDVTDPEAFIQELLINKT